MTGLEALRCLLIDRVAVRGKFWSPGTYIKADGADIVNENGNIISVAIFDWTVDGWEIYKQKETCTFAELFDKLKPGDEAWYELTDGKLRYCVIGGALNMLTHDNYCILPEITKELLNAKFVISRSGVA